MVLFFEIKTAGLSAAVDFYNEGSQQDTCAVKKYIADLAGSSAYEGLMIFIQTSPYDSGCDSHQDIVFTVIGFQHLNITDG